MPRAAYIVAVCDVLGFSNFVDKTPLEELTTRYEDLVRAAKPHRFFSNTSTGRVLDIPGVTSAVFSDTILVWAADDPQSIESFARYADSLIVWSVLEGLPIRMGIAFGDCLIDKPRGRYLGLPIVKAHRLEIAQEWIGGAFDRSCFEAEHVGNVLANSQAVLLNCPDVPFKSEERHQAVTAWTVQMRGQQIRNAVLDWPWLLEEVASNDGNPLAELFVKRRHAAPAEAKTKWDNARKFYVARRGALLPDFSPGEPA